MPVVPTASPLTPTPSSPGARATQAPVTPSATDATPVIAGIASAVVATVVIVVAVCVKKKRSTKRGMPSPTHLAPDDGSGPEDPPVAHGSSLAVVGSLASPYHEPPPPPYPGLVSYPELVATPYAEDTDKTEKSVNVHGASQRALPGVVVAGGGLSSLHGSGGAVDAGGGSAGVDERSTTADVSTADASIATIPGQVVWGSVCSGDDPVEPGPASNDLYGGPDSLRESRRNSNSGLGFPQAVAQAALELIDSSQIAGVSEAASLVCILVNLVKDSRAYSGSINWRVKRCRSIIDMLRKATMVLGKVR